MQNIIERGVILAREEITPRDLPPELLELEPSFQAGGGILKHREKEAISKTLQQCRGNRRQTADALGISLSTLQYRLKELELLVKKKNPFVETAKNTYRRREDS